jgi:diacylglycerol kinase
MHDEEPSRPKRPWVEKFRDAFRGLREGVRGQSSFRVHFAAAVSVVAAGSVLRVNLVEWSILLLAITVVLTAEMFNSALEMLAKAITSRHDHHLGLGLDAGSGAVLTASIGAAVVGTVVLGNRLGRLLGWW